jgi:hypothetical protein
MKITGIHALTGLIAAILSSAFSLGFFGMKNEMLAAAIGIAVLYVTGQLSDQLFEKREVTGIKSWLTKDGRLGDGILPFVSVWFLVWIVLYNYIGMKNGFFPVFPA